MATNDRQLDVVAGGTKKGSDEDLVAMICRCIRSLGVRTEHADPDTAVWYRMIEAEVADALDRSVRGWRSDGFSDAAIGRELGVTKQAVQKRWPR